MDEVLCNYKCGYYFLKKFSKMHTFHQVPVHRATLQQLVYIFLCRLELSNLIFQLRAWYFAWGSRHGDGTAVEDFSSWSPGINWFVQQTTDPAHLKILAWARIRIRQNSFACSADELEMESDEFFDLVYRRERTRFLSIKLSKTIGTILQLT